MVSTNSEALLGSIARKSDINYSEGVSISSIYNYDEMTRVEPVRYPDGSSLMRFLARTADRYGCECACAHFQISLAGSVTHPIDFAKA